MNSYAVGYVYDGSTGLAGGLPFGLGLAKLAEEKRVERYQLAADAGLEVSDLERVLAGDARLPVATLAALAQALRVRPIEFLQRTGFLSLEVYAQGLDPLFFLPVGPIRHDARIYMREINPRHAVPETDMTRRNPVLRAVHEDDLLDARSKLELELAYLLRVAVSLTGGRL